MKHLEKSKCFFVAEKKGWNMYQLSKIKIWFVKTFLCVHDFWLKDLGHYKIDFYYCKKCGKVTKRL